MPGRARLAGKKKRATLVARFFMSSKKTAKSLQIWICA
jgi:hypothetical protein